MRKIGVFVMLLFSAASARSQISDAALLDTIQHSAFLYFWNEANASNGLIKDRSASGAPCSIASTGFGLSAICIGVDHGWVSRAAARDRVLTTMKTFWYGPQGSGDGYIGMYGLFYHFLDMTTATRTWSSELSTIDTGLLLAGIVDARQYFDGADSLETLLRSLADSIYLRMNWNLMRNGYYGILMGWMPGTGFNGYGPWVGYNEASIMYILAMGSPTHPVDSLGWASWVAGYTWNTYYGYSYVSFPPLFGHQYSQCWLDLRSIADQYMRTQGITYFENSRRATLAQQSYCTANPHGFAGYSDTLWGITASDVPGVLHGGNTYLARGAPPDQNDDGTITPTAPISSIAFAPDSVLPVIRNMWNNYRTQLWTPYGFRDAFNPGVNWWDTDIIGIDQGPIIIMIENYLNQRVWNRFMQNPYILKGLQVAGFQPVTSVPPESVPGEFRLEQNFPNPFNPATVITYTLGGFRGQGSGVRDVRLVIYDVLGREVATLVNEKQSPGSYGVRFNATGRDGRALASGVYIYRLTAGDFTQSRTMLLLK